MFLLGSFVSCAVNPTVTTSGAENLPALVAGGNVLRTYTTLKLSIRLPPTLDAKGEAITKLKELLEKDPPYGAKVAIALISL